MSLSSLTPSQVDAIALTARSWLGTPYAHLGRLKGHACDCVGLVEMVAKELGIPSRSSGLDYAADGYGRDPHPQRMRDALLEHLEEVELDLPALRRGDTSSLGPGDILHLRSGSHARHLGIVLPREGGGLNLIHAWSGAGKVVEHNLDKVWLTLIRAGYRYQWPVSS